MTGSRHTQPLYRKGVGKDARLSTRFGGRGERPFSRPVGRTRSAQRKRPIFFSLVMIIATFSSASVAQPSHDCVAKLNRAALQAMNRTNPLGQMQIAGSPISFGPYLKRVEVGVYGARIEMYAVDIKIDGACNVLGASTRLETNEWPDR
jgi:hypothetical protein